MSKEIDTNGFWRIEHNPISKVGVFDYSGKSLRLVGQENKMFKVFRPPESLSDERAVKSFNGLFLIDDHQMLGEKFVSENVANAKKVDDARVGGAVFNTVYEDGVLYADLNICSEEMMEKIKSGKKELSLGYKCRFIPKQGVYEGTPYDFIQVDIRGNHVALVDKGRSGSDVRIFDSSERMVFDSAEPIIKEIKYMDKEKEANVGDEFLDVPSFLKAISNMGFSEEQLKKLQELTERTKYRRNVKDEAPDGGEKKEEGCQCGEVKDGAGNGKLVEEIAGILKEGKVSDEIISAVLEKVGGVPCSQDEEPKAKEEKKEDEHCKDEDPEEEGEEKKLTTTAEDRAELVRSITEEINKKNKLADQLSNEIGTFDSSEMSLSDVAVYGCKKLGLACDSGEELPTIRGYLSAASKVKSKPVSTMDALDDFGADKGIINYLK